MANTVSNTVGNLIDNPAPLPDGTVQTPFVVQIAAAGTTNITATPLTQEMSVITNNTAANGVMLPVGLMGQRLVVYPALGGATTPFLYPPAGGTYNGLAVNVGTQIPVRKTTEVFCADNAGLTWIGDN